VEAYFSAEASICADYRRAEEGGRILELGRELERERELEPELKLEPERELERELELEPEPELGRERRKPERGKGVYKRSGAAVVRQAAPSASTRPPAPLRILLLVLHVFDSTPSEGLPAPNGRVQVERRPQRWPPLPRGGTIVYASFTVSFRLGFASCHFLCCKCLYVKE
jgi:hypothetical protein